MGHTRYKEMIKFYHDVATVAGIKLNVRGGKGNPLESEVFRVKTWEHIMMVNHKTTLKFSLLNN